MMAVMMWLMAFVCSVLAGLFLYDAAAALMRLDWRGMALSALTCVSCLLAIIWLLEVACG